MVSDTSHNSRTSKKPKRRVGLWIVIGLLLIVGINGGIKGMQRGSQATQSKATRADFIADCRTDPQATESYCACVYDTMGEQDMLEAYDHYKATNEYNDRFKTVAAGCVKSEKAS